MIVAQHSARLEDPPRPVNRRRVRVTCAVVHCVLPGGHLSAEGDDNTFEMYTDDIERTRELVEHDLNKIQQAKDWVESSKAAYLAEKQREGRTEVKWDDVSWSYSGPTTWTAAFVHLFHRSVKPLRAVEYVDEVVLPPPMSGLEAVASKQIEAMARGLGEELRRSRGGRPPKQ